jgi:hypothetical protein
MSGIDDPAESRLRRRLRVAAGVTFLVLIAFMVVVGTLAPFLGQPDLHISEFVFGTLGGLVLLILGIEVPAWIRRK